MPGIIAGIDGSSHSQRALEWAVGEAAARRLPLIVINVYQPVAHVWGSAIACPEDPVLVEHARKAAQAQVDEAVTRSGGSDPESVAVRAVAASLPEGAQRGRRRRHDRGGLARRRRIRAAATRIRRHHLAHHAHCPVIVIPAEDRR